MSEIQYLSFCEQREADWVAFTAFWTQILLPNLNVCDLTETELAFEKHKSWQAWLDSSGPRAKV